MGIQDFWSTVESSGRNVSIESLRGKRFAVDISIWLNQIVRAMRTKTGDTIPNAHIYITVFRLCKLMYYGIKPVIVFDGDAPALKRMTLSKRRAKASKAEEKMDKLRTEILATEYVEQLKGDVISEEKAPLEKQTEETAEMDILEQNELELETLYNRAISDDEIIYVNLPYKNGVLHIAANTPQLLEVPKHLRPQVLRLLKNQLQNRSLQMLDEVSGDIEEVSKMQLRLTQFRSKVMKTVFSILRSESETDENASAVIRNGYEVVYKENPDPFHSTFDFSDFDSNSEKSDVEYPAPYIRSDEDPFEAKRRRMNEEYMASVNQRLWGVESFEDEAKEKEEGKVLLYTNLRDLMDHPDCSVHQYDGEIDRIQFGREEDKQQFKQLMQTEAEGGMTEEELYREFEAYCQKMDKKEEGLVLEVHEDGQIVVTGEIQSRKEKDLSQEGDGVIAATLVEEVTQQEGERVSPQGEEEITHPIEDGIHDVEEDISPQEEEKDQQMEEPSYPVVEEDQQMEEPLHPVEEEVPPINDLTPSQASIVPEEPTPPPSPSQLQQEAEKLFDYSLPELQQHKSDLLQQYQHVSSQNAFVSEDIILDILEILRIFGIPYMFAPCEAEAQCSYLEMMGLVDGVISNDSDVFAFGGKCLLKDFFVDSKYIQEFHMEDLEREKGLTQERIIEFALLRGCDYCEGVSGIGRVAAVELISFFPSFTSLRMLPAVIRGTVEWENEEWKAYFVKNKQKLETLQFEENFADQNLINAFLFPAVHCSLESFEWKEYDSTKMEAFLRNHPSVNESHIYTIIKPALANQRKEKQLKITDLLTYSKRSLVIKEKSRRLKEAFKRLAQLCCVYSNKQDYT